MGLDLPPVIKPGFHGRGVRTMKRELVRHLRHIGDTNLASRITIDDLIYGPNAVRGVKVIQRRNGLHADGIVGRRTWALLGIKPSDIAPVSLKGIPWETGLRSIDGCWVPENHHARLMTAKRRGWTGTVNSGYRPDWYQKQLYDAAVAKYGASLAGRYVAPPGRSNHRFKNDKCAIDANNSQQLRQIEHRWYQRMPWEPWHNEWRPAYGLATRLAAKLPQIVEPVMIPPAQQDVSELTAGIDEMLMLIGQRMEISE